ncbi:MAG: hypothetical protein JWO11_689, partial [Nocardioides sp.]|nr:hypothetical protein [Nocardioides sp.]
MGDGASDDSSESGFDLFDRWLAHHDEQVTRDAADAAKEWAPAPGASAEDPQPLDDPDPAPAPPADTDPLFDGSFPTDGPAQTVGEPEFESLIETGKYAEPPGLSNSDEVGRSILEALAAALPDPAPAQPVTPTNFEPVIIASARNKKPASRRSPLSGRRRAVAPEPIDVPVPVPVADVAEAQAADLAASAEESAAAQRALDAERAAEAEAAAQRAADAQRVLDAQRALDAERAAEAEAAAERAAAAEAE